MELNPSRILQILGVTVFEETAILEVLSII